MGCIYGLIAVHPTMSCGHGVAGLPPDLVRLRLLGPAQSEGKDAIDLECLQLIKQCEVITVRALGVERPLALLEQAGIGLAEHQKPLRLRCLVGRLELRVEVVGAGGEPQRVGDHLAVGAEGADLHGVTLQEGELPQQLASALLLVHPDGCLPAACGDSHRCVGGAVRIGRVAYGHHEGPLRHLPGDSASRALVHKVVAAHETRHYSAGLPLSCHSGIGRVEHDRSASCLGPAAAGVLVVRMVHGSCVETTESDAAGNLRI
mmetsp:Transcript_105695/g.252101  ORF Transcript_105695/g.252101 Transcript_105695/m.252101 type:complete len:261 (-) Transcript_105695:7352-8134(-)